jgi:class 3 adenylate cyclase/tetratricopeptide (TPR) repeat protein
MDEPSPRITHPGRDADLVAPDAELRLATAVKCDIVGSTQIWTGLDPSDGLALARAFRKSVNQVVSQHGGYVERWEGDGALILFGYPHAREDAPEAAVRAGLALLQSVRAIHSGSAVLELRIGIASGAIAVDLIDRSLEGVALNVAERLKAIADPNQVVIDESTRRLAKSFFEYRDLGMRPAKGFENGLQAWQVVAETAVVSRFEAQRFDLSGGEIIGRDAELARLARAWAESRAGTGQVVSIFGDAGMGKSRLARAVFDWASRDNAERVEIDCTPSTRNSPLFPVGVWLRRAAGMTDPLTPPGRKSELARQFIGSLLEANEAMEAMDALAPVLGLSMSSDPAAQAPDTLREITISSIVKVLRAYTAHGPLLLLCEDLHWADDTTATAIQRFAKEASSMRVLLMVTSRSKPEVALGGDGNGCDEIALAPLSEADSADLVHSVAKGAALAGTLVSDIVRRCEGVPLILEEVTRGALESSSRADALATGASMRGPVPAPLQLVVESRLERWQQHKAVVQAASVLGREFSVSLLEQMVPNQAAGVSQVIRLLAEHGLFLPSDGASGDRARFSHAMIRDAVYQTLLRNDRRQLHSRVADKMRSAHSATLDVSSDELAQHLCEAARYEESIQVHLAASEDTVKRGAYVEAEGHCKAALKIIDKVQDAARRRELQFNLQIQKGVALTGRHGYSAPQVESAYREAREACGETAHAEMLYPIMRGLTAFNLVSGKLAAGYDLSLQSMALAEQSARPAYLIDAMSVHCYATMYYRSLEECRSWIKRCLALYQEAGGENLSYPVPNDPATAALAILPTVEWLLGDSAAAEAAIRQGLQHVDRPDHEFDKAYMHAWIAGVRLTQRRHAQSREAAQKAVEISQRHGFEEWFVTGFLIDRLAQAAMAPSPDALKEAYDTCMALATKGVGLNASWYLWGLARGFKVAGQDAHAAQLIDQAFLRAEASEETRMNAELLISKAELTHDVDVAAELLRKALELADAHGAIANALRAAAALAVRVGADPAAVELGQSTLQLLDGQGDYPTQDQWMAERLATLRQALAVGSTQV